MWIIIISCEAQSEKTQQIKDPSSISPTYILNALWFQKKSHGRSSWFHQLRKLVESIFFFLNIFFHESKLNCIWRFWCFRRKASFFISYWSSSTNDWFRAFFTVTCWSMEPTSLVSLSTCFFYVCFNIS